MNGQKINTRLDPGKGTGSVLDLEIVSANIEESVTHFTVDSERKMTAFAMVKKTNNIIEKQAQICAEGCEEDNNTHLFHIQCKHKLCTIINRQIKSINYVKTG